MATWNKKFWKSWTFNGGNGEFFLISSLLLEQRNEDTEEDSRYTVGQCVVDDARRLGGGIVLLNKRTGNIHQGHVVTVDVVELQTHLGHFIYS